MAEPFIWIGNYTIKDGQKDAYLEHFAEVRDLVRDGEPDMLYFAEHLSQDGSEATTVQVHANAENMERHMALIGDHVRAATEYLDFSTISISIYGEPTDAILEQTRELAGSGATVSINPAVVGFDRFDAA